MKVSPFADSTSNFSVQKKKKKFQRVNITLRGSLPPPISIEMCHPCLKDHRNPTLRASPWIAAVDSATNFSDVWTYPKLDSNFLDGVLIFQIHLPPTEEVLLQCAENKVKMLQLASLWTAQTVAYREDTYRAPIANTYTLVLKGRRITFCFGSALCFVRSEVRISSFFFFFCTVWIIPVCVWVGCYENGGVLNK